MILQFCAQTVGRLAGFARPVRMRIDLQVAIPVIERLMVEELMLGDDGAIKERDRIVGVESQGLAQVLVSRAEIVLAVFLLGALEVSGG